MACGSQIPYHLNLFFLRRRSNFVIMKKRLKNEQDGSLNFAEGNNFYIFGSIDETIPKAIIVPFINALTKQENKVDKDEFHIYITSPGGRVDYGFDLITQIESAKKIGVIVNTYVSSSACSCGSLIAVAGSKRYVSKRAFHLLHFARGWDFSHNPTMVERNAENALWMQNEIVAHYKKYTKLRNIPSKLTADNFMINGSADLIANGLADEEM